MTVAAICADIISTTLERCNVKTKDPEIEVVDENYDFLWKEIYDLEHPDKDVIELFYIHGLKQVEIAKHLKISKSRICRIHMNVLDRLKHRLEGLKQNE